MGRAFFLRALLQLKRARAVALVFDGTLSCCICVSRGFIWRGAHAVAVVRVGVTLARGGISSVFLVVVHVNMRSRV